MDSIRFVTDQAALTIGRALVVSDLHIGIEYRYRRDGIALPSQTERLLKRVEALIKKARAKRLVVIGDVKHKVPGTSFQEEREVPAFFRSLRSLVEIDVVPGNHDGGLDRLLPRGVTLHPGTGFMLGKRWLCHGHAWPEREFLEAQEVVMGHNHAGFEFRDKLGYRWVEPVWVRAEFDRERLSGRYGDLGSGLPGIVLIPVFNEFSGYIPLNRERKDEGYEFPNPVFRAANLETARVFMLDGTYLGKVGRLKG